MADEETQAELPTGDDSAEAAAQLAASEEVKPPEAEETPEGDEEHAPASPDWGKYSLKEIMALPAEERDAALGALEADAAKEGVALPWREEKAQKASEEADAAQLREKRERLAQVQKDVERDYQTLYDKVVGVNRRLLQGDQTLTKDDLIGEDEFKETLARLLPNYVTAQGANNTISFATAIIEKINAYGDPIDAKTTQALAERAAKSGGSLLGACLDELVTRAQTKTEGSVEQRIEAEVKRRLSAERGAMRIEIMRELSGEGGVPPSTDKEPTPIRGQTPDINTIAGIHAARRAGKLSDAEARAKIRERTTALGG